MSAAAHNGSCHCGRVTFRADGDPKFISACHCDSCRRSTGAAFSVWAGFPSTHVNWLGESPTFYASSKGVQRGFCRSCGTPLSYQGEKWPEETHFLIGVFKDPSPFAPKSDYMVEGRLSWVKPVVEKQ
ncbi:MAG: GFA family protein [Parvularculaceae bacterium]|nr:GFA family protein [Parvularculaceae bacterium]